MRLLNKNRKDIKIGDEICFCDNLTKENIYVEVVGVHKFKNFEELYSTFDKTRLGYSSDEIANPNDMEKYYSKENILRYGVLGIQIKLEL